MKRYILFIWCISIHLCTIAQFSHTTELGYFADEQEQLLPLERNVLQHIAPTSKRHKYLVDKKIYIVSTDTLNLPFVDDFTTDRTRDYLWLGQNVTDTFYNVFGTCLANEGIETINESFLTDTAWAYTLDTLNNRYDSVAIPPLRFTFFGPLTAECFSQAPQAVYFWEPYYRFFINSNNQPDSLWVQPNQNINYAPVVYFAKGQPGTLWFDSYAYINTTYPNLPPTIGVATLDGLNEFGLPYNNSNNNTYGDADKLTSLPINLNGLNEGDSVYLSFYYEGMGLGDFPEIQDSLMVEFKDNSGTWRRVWDRPGYATLTSVPDKFEQVLVKVPALTPPFNFFHSTFQFRIRNKAALYGNLDHWHIDYVRLDKNRSAVDTVIQDIAFVYQMPNVLKNFTIMPGDHFISNDDLADTITLTIANLDPNASANPPATNFIRSANITYPSPSVVFTSPVQTFNADNFNFVKSYPSTEYTLPTGGTWPVDSLVFTNATVISPTDARPQNDTVRSVLKFSNVLAYDDGSAERAYGLFGLGKKQFAYRFDLAVPDTLVGFQIMFAQVEQNVSDLIFNFYLWDSIRVNDFSFVDTPIYEIVNKKPLYVDSVNGYATYVLDTPLLVNDKIYMGWSQTDERSMQIGYDLNSPLGRKHMYAYTNSVWKPSTISVPGSPMIRLIFDTDYYGGSTSVKDLYYTERFNVYPNPVKDELRLSGNLNEFTALTVFNLSGQQILTEQTLPNRLNLAQLSPGIYIVTARHIRSGKIYHHKVVKL